MLILARVLAGEPTNSAQLSVLGDGAVQIVVPAPSLERLASIQALCAAQTGTALAFTAPQAQADLAAYIAQVEAAAQLPPGCAADLLAVARALLAREG